MASLVVRISLAATLSMGLSGSGLCRGVEPDLWRFVHPNAKALIGIHWSRVQESELGRWIQRKWIHGLAMPGAEFLTNINEVLISSPGASATTDQEEPPLLIALRGNFDLVLVEEVLLRQGARKQMFGRIPIWRPSDKSSADPVFAVLDPETILTGDLQSIFSTIERAQIDSSLRSNELFLEHAQILANRYDCWALMRDNVAMHNFLLASLAGGALSADSQGFEAGINVRDGLAMDVTLKVRTDRSARRLHAKLTRMISLAALEKARSGGFAALLDKLRVTPDGSNVLLSLRVSGVEAAKSLTPVQVVAEELPVPTPLRNFTIRIEGLDEGTREVPFKP